MGRALALAVASLVFLTGCPRPGLCSLTTLRTEVANPKAFTWSELLLYGHSRKQEALTRPSLDCTGVPVMWQEPRADECAEPGPMTDPLRAASPLPSEDDVTVRLVGSGLQLVWLRVQSFANGEAEGPVALVATDDDRLVVEALGTLRSLPITRLTLESVGPSRVLVAEGELCAPGEPPVCQSTTRLLLMRRGRFVAMPIVSPEGKCLGPDWFPRHREQTYPLPTGMRRKIEQTTSLDLKDDRVLVNESIDVRDLDPRQKGSVPEPFHTTRAKRTLLIHDSRIVSDAPSPWPAVIDKFAKGIVQLEGSDQTQPTSASSPGSATQRTETAPAGAPPLSKPVAQAATAAPADAPRSTKPSASSNVPASSKSASPPVTAKPPASIGSLNRR